MTECWKTPHPRGLERMRQFWDATLDRLAIFMQAKDHSNLHTATPPQPTKPASRSDERSQHGFRGISILGSGFTRLVGEEGSLWLSTRRGSPRSRTPRTLDS